ncbi:MAG: beta-lactamase family protein [Ruminococcaceae bacterium]|nr:beta-lactamase family protein [Oscillospiraceae bacterium]
MNDFSKVRDFIDLIAEEDINLCGIEVRHGHDIVLRHFMGYADAEKQVKLSDNNIYWLYSCTKVITCLAAMRLVEEGRLGLEDTLDKYLPEFASMKVKTADGIADAKNKIRIIDLFTMSAGFTYDLYTPELNEVCANKNASTREVVSALSRSVLEFEPGTNYNYSLCHDILAAVIEVVTGMRFSDYLDEIMFTPLGIKNMGFHPSDKEMKRMAVQYDYDNIFRKATPRAPFNKYRLTGNYDSGGAGLYSNLSDYSKIIDAVANGGVAENGYRLLKGETVAMLGVNRLKTEAQFRSFVKSPRWYGYGYGLCGRVMMDPLASLSRSSKGEFGWDGACCSYALIDPAEKLSVFLTTHLCADYIYERVHPYVRNLIYEAIGK